VNEDQQQAIEERQLKIKEMDNAIAQKQKEKNQLVTAKNEFINQPALDNMNERFREINDNEHKKLDYWFMRMSYQEKLCLHKHYRDNIDKFIDIIRTQLKKEEE